MKNLEYNWRPRPVSHLFKHYKTGQWILLEIRKNEDGHKGRFEDLDSSGWQIKEFESVTLWALGTSTGIWKNLVQEAKNEFSKQTRGKTVIYRYSRKQEMWTVFGNPKVVRPWKTIVTQNNIKDSLLHDIEKFRSSSKEYQKLGIPYRRGYLLYGPPGTGKSSLVCCLAGKLKVNLCILTLSERDLGDDELMNRLAAAPKNSIVLLEDIDVAIPSQKRRHDLEAQARRKGDKNNDAMGYGYLTTSGILNALDGVATVDSQIIVMTTNHKENLDPALIRPGRYCQLYFC